MTAGQGFGLGRERPRVTEDLTVPQRLSTEPARLSAAEHDAEAPPRGGPDRPAHDIRPQKAAPPPRRIVAPRPR